MSKHIKNQKVGFFQSVWVWIIFVVVIAMICVSAYYGIRKPVKTSDKPLDLNVIFISLDNARTNTKLYGYNRDTMPNLDAVGRDGVVFQNAMVNVTWTLPSHMTMLTGLYPSSHGVDDRGKRLDADAITLAEWLKRFGYRTRAIVSKSFVAPAYGFNQGFDRFTSVGNRYAPKVNEEAFEFLDKNKDEKFFLFLHILDIHTPFDPPEEYQKLYDPDYTGKITGAGSWVAHYTPKNRPIDPRDLEHMIALYDAGMKYVDDNLKLLFDRLKQLGLWENTLLIVTSDHGEEFKEHGSMDHGLALYDEQLRVPLYFHNPIYIARGLMVPNQVSAVDYFPTITDFLNLPQCNQVEGKSFAPYLRGDLSYQHTDSTLIETKDRNRLIRGIRSNSWKYLNIISRKTKELYNLKEDPKETTNVIEAHAEVAERYEKEIEHWMNVADNITFTPEKSNVDKDLADQLAALGYVDGKAEAFDESKAKQKQADAQSKEKLNSLGYVDGKKQKKQDKLFIVKDKLFTFDRGANYGQVNEPRVIAYDSNGNLYIVDFRNYRIQKFDPQYKFIVAWGSEGSNPGQFKDATGICIDDQNTIYIADTWNHRIQKFNSDGKYLDSISINGLPRGIALLSDGSMVVANSSRDQILVLNKLGKEILTFGKNGSGQGEFDKPCGVAADKQDNIYIADANNRRIQKFSKDGKFLLEIPFGGEIIDRYCEPYLVLDKQENIYLTDSQRHEVKKFSAQGKLLSKLGTKGRGSLNFTMPTGITLDPKGNIIVVDTWNHRLVKLLPVDFK